MNGDRLVIQQAEVEGAMTPLKMQRAGEPEHRGEGLDLQIGQAQVLVQPVPFSVGDGLGVVAGPKRKVASMARLVLIKPETGRAKQGAALLFASIGHAVRAQVGQGIQHASTKRMVFG